MIQTGNLVLLHQNCDGRYLFLTIPVHHFLIFAFSYCKNYGISNKDDFLIICSVGAYGSSMASNYNLRDIADEFIIDGKKIY